jgi:hypothetical protein
MRMRKEHGVLAAPPDAGSRIISVCESNSRKRWRAVVAVAHKLARIIHAVLRTRRPYEAALQRKARSLGQLKRKAKTLGFKLTTIQQPTGYYLRVTDPE